VGATEHVHLVISRSLNCGALAQCTAASTPRYPLLEIVLPAALLGRQWLVTNHTEWRGRVPVTAFIRSFSWCLAASSDEEGGKMTRAPCRLFTYWCSSSCGRPVVLLWTVWAGDQDDVQPLCAIKHPAIGCWHLGSGGTETTIYCILDYLHRHIWLTNPYFLHKLGPLLSRQTRLSSKNGLGATVAR